MAGHANQFFTVVTLAQALFLLAGVSTLPILFDVTNGAAGLESVAFAVLSGSLVVSGTLAVALCKTTKLRSVLGLDPARSDNATDGQSAPR